MKAGGFGGRYIMSCLRHYHNVAPLGLVCVGYDSFFYHNAAPPGLLPVAILYDTIQISVIAFQISKTLTSGTTIFPKFLHR
jgi:hypothetical protein